MMNKINYNNRKFCSAKNTGTGEVGADTIFDYHQSGNTVWAEYSGGVIERGNLIAICDMDGGLDMRYHHVNKNGVLMTGICSSTPEILPDGRIRLYEKWRWTSGDLSSGESLLEEI